jgi:hypothetical protein
VSTMDCPSPTSPCSTAPPPRPARWSRR